MLSRRRLLQMMAAGGVATLVPRLSLAAAPTDKRLVVVVLRGGLDGLHAVPPYADANYRRLRSTLAIGRPGEREGAVDLDGYFGLHPSLGPLRNLYQSGELLVVPASTTRYRKRSHFDGQNLLENGSGKPFGAKDGWLNRAVASLGGGPRRLGLALGPTVPLLLHGEAPVRTWSESPLPEADEDFLQRLAYTYKNDALFARALADAKDSKSMGMDGQSTKQRRRGKEIAKAARAAATLLSHPEGPRIAVMEMGGWDTHFGQSYRLANQLRQLTQGLLDLRTNLAAHWRDTVVLVVSEFGRTAAENGSRGTDHGTGGIALALGGAVEGGRVLGRWPGLGRSDLLDGRDVRPTTAYESLFKGVLHGHLGIAEAVLEQRIFPDSRSLPLLPDVVRRV